jgi:hypothetical protein
MHETKNNVATTSWKIGEKSIENAVKVNNNNAGIFHLFTLNKK